MTSPDSGHFWKDVLCNIVVPFVGWVSPMVWQIRCYLLWYFEIVDHVYTITVYFGIGIYGPFWDNFCFDDFSILVSSPCLPANTILSAFPPFRLSAFPQCFLMEFHHFSLKQMQRPNTRRFPTCLLRLSEANEQRLDLADAGHRKEKSQ